MLADELDDLGDDNDDDDNNELLPPGLGVVAAVVAVVLLLLPLSENCESSVPDLLASDLRIMTRRWASSSSTRWSVLILRRRANSRRVR
jgi:hypothetical protein